MPTGIWTWCGWWCATPPTRPSIDVDFATVWGLGHTVAERTGDGPTNFIAWVKETVAK